MEEYMVWFSRINYLTFVILVMAGIFFYNDYILWALLFAMIVTPIISYFVTRRNKDKVRIKIEFDKVTVGENAYVKLNIIAENKSILPIENLRVHLKLNNRFYDAMDTQVINMSVAPFKNKKLEFGMNIVYFGRVLATIEKAEVYDIFGMWKFDLDTDSNSEIICHPFGKVEIDEVPISTDGSDEDEELQLIKGDDISQISQIRDYIPGDKLQNIHWKLSAKEEELQVKEFSQPYSRDIILLVDLYKENAKGLNEVIKYVYAVGNDVIEQGRKFYLTWFDGETSTMNRAEVNNTDELLIAMSDLYYAKPGKNLGEAMDLYEKFSNSKKEVVIEVSSAISAPSKGDKVILSDGPGVILTCV